MSMASTLKDHVNITVQAVDGPVNGPSLDHLSRRYTTTSTRTCPHCSRELNAKGFTAHERACGKRAESAKRDREFEEQVALNIVDARKAKRARLLEESISKILRSNVDAVNHRDNNRHPPQDVAQPETDQVEIENPPAFDEDIQQDTITSEDDTRLPVPQAELNPEDPYLLDDIKIEFHPNSRRDCEIYHFDNFSRKNAYIDSIPTDSEPWRPFRCRTDYEFARIALEAALGLEQINQLIKIVKSIAEGAKFTLSSSKDVMDTWKAASLKLTPFEKSEIVVHHKKEEKKYEVWSRSLWSYAVELLKDKRLMPHFFWDAQRLYKYDGSSFVRFIDEPWTADRFWEIQSTLPVGANPLCFILYADKNKLSSFGTVKGYPVVARCANLHVDIRNSNGIGGGRIVGWLPVVEEDAATNKLLTFTNHKREVWHKALYEILKSIIALSKVGFNIVCGDGIDRRVFPCILMLSADYEEQTFMALIRGATSDFPCPVCLVKHKDLSDLACIPALRTAVESKKAVEEALTFTKKKAEEELKKKGLRLIKNVFWDLANSDPHRAISWDRLHAYNSGLFGGHIWKEFKSVLASEGREIQENLDNNFSTFPRFRNLHHFNGVLHIAFNDGSKFEDLGKQLLYAAHSLIDSKQAPSAYLLLRCLRSYLELDTYLSFEVHTEHTITAGERELLNFSKLIAEYSQISSQEFDDPKDWGFIKMHLQQHAFADVRAKGATRNFNTKPNEQLHGPLRDSYHLRTNYKNVAKQILAADHYLLVSSLIKTQLYELDQYEIDQNSARKASNDATDSEECSDVSGGDEANNTVDFDYQHFSLGSTKKPATLRHIEESNAHDPAFRSFRKRLSEHLTTSFQAFGIPLPGNKRIHLGAEYPVLEHRYLKIHYESMVTWKMLTDHLRCNPKFFGQPRYDSVIFRVVDKEIFGRLIFMFSVDIEERTYPVALVQPCDAPTGVRRLKDLDMRLTRVKARPRSASEFISIHSIRRGAVLVPDSNKDGEYIVMDVLDSDMFLRVKDLNDSY